MRLLVILAIASSGCYSPNVGSCKVSCFGDQPCPGDQTCGADSYCHEAGEDQVCMNSFELTIEIVGDGHVTGPGGLDCPGNCTVTLVEGTQPLVAIPTNESRLAAWSVDQGELSPACTDEECSLELRRNTTLTAQFNPAKTLTIEFDGEGTGKVKVGGTRECTKSCTRKIDVGAMIALEASADAPATFTWGGECADRPPTAPCSLTFDTGHDVAARFDAIVLTLLPIPDGSGTITLGATSTTPARTCPPDCTILFSPSPVPTPTLIAQPATDHLFDRWINLCEGMPSPCSMQPVPSDLLVIGLFDSKPSITVHLNGGGTVGIKGGSNATVTCGSGPVQVTTCTESFDPGTTVQLGANPDPADVFLQWKFCPTSSQEMQTTCAFTLAAGDHFHVTPSFIGP